LVYFLCGHKPLVVQILQILIGSTSCLLFYLLGKRLFGNAAGWITGCLAALYQPFIFYDGVLLKGNITIFLELVTLLCLLRAVKPTHPRWAGDRGITRESAASGTLWAAAAGLLLGLTALNRGNFLLAVPVVLAWLWLQIRNRKTLSRLGGFFLLGFALALAPSTLHNYMVERDLVLINYTAGINFFAGNNPMASGIHTSPPVIRTVPEFEENDARVYAERETRRALKPSEIGRFWYRKGFSFIKKHLPPPLAQDQAIFQSL